MPGELIKTRYRRTTIRICSENASFKMPLSEYHYTPQERIREKGEGEKGEITVRHQVFGFLKTSKPQRPKAILKASQPRSLKVSKHPQSLKTSKPQRPNASLKASQPRSLKASKHPQSLKTSKPQSLSLKASTPQSLNASKPHSLQASKSESLKASTVHSAGPRQLKKATGDEL